VKIIIQGSIHIATKPSKKIFARFLHPAKLHETARPRCLQV
jgi:hypothetical protein